MGNLVPESFSCEAMRVAKSVSAWMFVQQELIAPGTELSAYRRFSAFDEDANYVQCALLRENNKV